jgi:hypothetical protein
MIEHLNMCSHRLLMCVRIRSCERPTEMPLNVQLHISLFKTVSLVIVCLLINYYLTIYMHHNVKK